MFITREDYHYLEGLHQSLPPAQRERFMTLLLGKGHSTAAQILCGGCGS
jgi:hypothetical protein